MKNKKICVYTSITGNYDNLNEISSEFYENNIDYYCFTNNKKIKSNTWNVIYVDEKDISNQLLARKIKILGNDITNKYDVTVWVDGNTCLKNKISEFLKDEIDFKKYDMASFKHRFRDCIYDEAIECAKSKKDNKEIIKKQIDLLKMENYPKHNGLYETGVIVRKNNEIIKNTMKLWFDILSNYSIRDQLSLNYVIFKSGINVQTIDMNVTNNKYFEIIGHNKNNIISSYRVYFGKDDSYENYNYDLDYIYDYKVEKDLYIAKFKVPVNTKIINFFVSDIGGILINNINCSVDCKIKNINIYDINNFKVILNENGIINMIGDFKKDDIIELSFNMRLIDSFSYNVLLKSYYENDKEQSKYIKALEKKRKELERRIRLKNKDYKDISITYNNLVGAYNNIENVHFDLEKLYRNLEKNYNNMVDKYNDLEKKYKNLEKEHNLVINSKGWQTLEKLRKLKK